MSQRGTGTRADVARSAPSTEVARPSWGAIADAVGHCVLVFAFAPPLVELPRWFFSEATNRLNLEDPVVLAFLPVRAGLVLVNAFFDGVAQGVLAGVLAGLLLSGWYVRRGGVPATTGGRALLGAGCGGCGAAVMVGVMLSLLTPRPEVPGLPAAAVAFEILSGTVCGVLAIPHAVRLLTAVAGRDRRPVASPA